MLRALRVERITRMTNMTYLGKCGLTRIGDHGQCGDGLFLDKSLHWIAFGTRVK